MIGLVAKRPSPSTESELALVAACVRGDEAAWERFYARYQPGVVGAARHALTRLGVAQPEEAAQDVAAEVFAALLANERATLASFQGRSSVATWLGVLARRQAARGLRRKRPGALDASTEVQADAPAPDALALASEERARVRAQVSALAPRDRLALQLFYEGGRSYQEVGRALGVPAERMGTLLARARARLAKALGLRP